MQLYVQYSIRQFSDITQTNGKTAYKNNSRETDATQALISNM